MIASNSGVNIYVYSTLKQAFDAINAGTHTGSIQISVQGNTTETLPAVLDGVGVWTANYTDISIYPSGGVARTISGAITEGNPLIDLDGADNVTIDGINSGGNSLTFSNTTISNISGTCTFRFRRDATNNIITRCSILGSSTSNINGNGGNIWFGSMSTITGNDDNTISNCDIGPAGANLPSKGIYFSGSTNNHPGTANSGTVITGCRIFDYFSATGTSAGIAVNNGTVNGTFTNNTFYQTAPRTQTLTGISHRAISINNTLGNGYQVTGNTIGFANASGTGTYALVFPTSTTNTFYPIYMNVGATTTSEVLSNTIAGIAVSGGAGGSGSATPFSCIYENAGRIEPRSNTIGSQSATGSITFTTNNINGADVNGIYSRVASSWFTQLNTIGGITVHNTSIGVLRFRGIHADIPVGLLFTSDQNTVGGTVANSIQNLSTASSSITIGVHNPLANSYIEGCTVRHLTASGGQGTGASSSITGILCPSTSAVGSTLGRNTIRNLRNIYFGNTRVQGILFSGNLSSTDNQITANQVYDLDAGHATSALLGIVVESRSCRVDNNMVRLGVVGNSATLGMSITGMLDDVSAGNNFYYNSVYIGGAPTNGSQSTHAFRSLTLQNTRNYLNNIFFNARSNAGSAGKHYAIEVNTSITTPPPGLTCNYNILRVTGTGGFLGDYLFGDQLTLSNWRNATGQDLNSLDLDPSFMAPGAATADLHLAPPSPAEGAGVIIPGYSNIALDIDGDLRSALSPEDIGADAGHFGPPDIAPPTFVVSPASQTCAAVPLFVSATISDTSGVPVSGVGLPRLVWRISGGSWQSLPGVYNAGTSSYEFTFGAGSSGGDVIQYYLVAQDMAATPNIGTWPSAGSAGFTYDPPAASTPPTSLLFNNVPHILSGNYAVGPGGQFVSLYDAVTAFSYACLNGPVVFLLTAPTYNESPVYIEANIHSSSTNTLTIRPAPGNTPIINVPSNTAAVILDGASWVTIDGYSGSSGPITNSCCPLVQAPRQMVLQNTHTQGEAVIWLGNTSKNNTIRNCSIRGHSSFTTDFGIITGTSRWVQTTGLDVDSNTIENNDIRAVRIGILSTGTEEDKNEGNRFLLNEMIDAIDPIGEFGIVLGYQNNVEVACNTISNITNGLSGAVRGISLGYNVATNQLDNPLGTREVTNATITNNTIGNIVQSQGFSATGIAYGNATSGTTTIANNMVWGVRSNSGLFFNAGIMVAGGTGSTIRVLHNTVSMQGAITGASSDSYCLVVPGLAVAGIEIQNNIFSNTQLAISGANSNLAMGLSPNDLTGLVSNYNDLHSSGPVPGLYPLVKVGNTVYNTLGEWSSGTGRDVNSTSALPLFVGTEDLHLDVDAQSNINVLMNGGTATLISSDIDCATRSATAPTIGADEFFSPPCNGIPAAGTSSGPGLACTGESLVFTNNAMNGLGGLSYRWHYSATSSGGPWSSDIGGSGMATRTYTSGPFSPGIHYLVFSATCTLTGDSALSNVITLVVDTFPNITASVGGGSLLCDGGSKTITAFSDMPGTTFEWTHDASISPSTMVSPLFNTLYNVVGTTPGGCTNFANTLIEVAQGPVATTLSEPTEICLGDPVTLTTTVTPVNYTTTNSSGVINVYVPDASVTGATVPLVLTNGTGTIQQFTGVSATISITTTANANMDAYLIGPDNCGTLELTTDNGGNGDNYLNTTFTTLYPTTNINTLTGVAHNITGTWNPEGTLITEPLLSGGFNGGSYSLPTTPLVGCPVNGAWTLFVADDTPLAQAYITYFELTIQDGPGGLYTMSASGSGTAGPFLYGGTNNQTGTVSVAPATAGTQVYTITTVGPSGCTATSTATLVVQPDTDGDGACDAVDGCPSDPNKIEPGACGCGVPDAVEVCNGLDDDCDGFIDEDCTVNLLVFALLDGPYNPMNGLMNGGLRDAGQIPLTEPYTAMGYTYVGSSGGTTTPAVLAMPGADAVLDWVVLELRSAMDPSVVVASRSALMERDGNVNAPDGTFYLSFTVPPGGYFVAIRHRNHLGCMTAAPILFNTGLTIVDFTHPSQATFGTEARKSTSDGRRALWAGNVNFDSQVKYLGASDDRDLVLGAIGGTVLTTVLSNVYHQADVNMNGEVKYLGAGDDRDPILNTIGGVILNSVRVEQVP